MTKFYISSLLVALVLAGSAYAQGNSVNVRAENQIRERTQMAASSTGLGNASGTKVRANIQAEVQARVTQQLNRLITRLKAAVVRIENLLERAKSRIAKFEDAGRDQAEAKGKIAAAETKLQAAAEAVTALEAKLNQSIASSTPGAAFRQARPEITPVIELIKAAHQSVVDVIRSIKTVNN